jgi:hypothetical protein
MGNLDLVAARVGACHRLLLWRGGKGELVDRRWGGLTASKAKGRGDRVRRRSPPIVAVELEERGSFLRVRGDHILYTKSTWARLVGLIYWGYGPNCLVYRV